MLRIRVVHSSPNTRQQRRQLQLLPHHLITIINNSRAGK
jgi:hypothetical protein